MSKPQDFTSATKDGTTNTPQTPQTPQTNTPDTTATLLDVLNNINNYLNGNDCDVVVKGNTVTLHKTAVTRLTQFNIKLPKYATSGNYRTTYNGDKLPQVTSALIQAAKALALTVDYQSSDGTHVEYYKPTAEHRQLVKEQLGQPLESRDIAMLLDCYSD